MVAVLGRLYLVVTPSLCRADPKETVAAAIDGGAGIVQLRDKRMSDEDFLALARELVAVCHERGVPLVVNDRVWLVRACGADGVHVGESDLSPEQVRRELGPGVLLGLSTHDRAEVAAARARGADYAGLGPMYATETKRLERSPRGPGLVREAVAVADLPLFPIGGIHAGNLAALVAAGADRAAVSSAICGAEDPRAAARTLRTLLPPE